MPGMNRRLLSFIPGDLCYEKGLKAHIKLMNTENMTVLSFIVSEIMIW